MYTDTHTDEQIDTMKNFPPTQIKSFALRLSSLHSESLGARNNFQYLIENVLVFLLHNHMPYVPKFSSKYYIFKISIILLF